MIRPMQHSDVTDVLTLLEWMDDRAEREVFAPDARTPDDLRWESRDKLCLVDVDDLGGIRAYCAVAPFWGGPDGGLVIEGPLSMDGAVAPILRAALNSVEGSVYAFCARDNEETRRTLESAGFSAMNTTEFYRRRSPIGGRATPLPPGLSLSNRADPDVYRALYRASEDVWATRLDWSTSRFRAHFGRDDVRFVLLSSGRQPVGFAELELGEVAQLTYLAVHPAERGQGYGRLLLREATRIAFETPGVLEIRARAHGHERPARTLYEREGFELCRCVVTYLRGDG